MISQPLPFSSMSMICRGGYYWVTLRLKSTAHIDIPRYPGASGLGDMQLNWRLATAKNFQLHRLLRYPRFSCLLFGGRFWCAIKEVKLKGFIACSVDSVDLVLLRYFCHFWWILFQSRCTHSPGSEISDRCIRRSVAQLCTTFPLASKHHSCHKLCHKLQNFYGILL
jgi:hypothetical protein